ncbi:MAG: DUF6498-containing protein [Planctomycetota bacterium]|nr:DUF6498-containing protein [Planctomycetota bacterium]
MPDASPPHRLPLVLLLLLNAGIFIAMMTLGGDVAFVIAMIWAECLVIGLYAIPKTLIVAASGDARKRARRAVAGAVLSIVSLGALVAVVVLLNEGTQMMAREVSAGSQYYGVLVPDMFEPAPWQAWMLIGAMAVSHGSSFVLNFLGRREYETMTLFDPWKWAFVRMIALILAIALGMVLLAGIAKLFRGHVADPDRWWLTVGLGLLLLILRLAADVSSHLLEHGQRLLSRWRLLLRQM